LLSVIGADDGRARILDTEYDPWRMICSLIIRSPAGEMKGTGWFAGPQTVVTAGHCVFDPVELGGWAHEIEVRPGRDGNELPFGVIHARSFSSIDAWEHDQNPDFDVGCIHLDTPIGEGTGWFGISTVPTSELRALKVNVAGYPEDRDSGVHLYHHRNDVLRVSNNRIYYSADTGKGQSGAPVWIQESASSAPVVIGIHAFGSGATPPRLRIEANSAVRINRDLISIIKNWRDISNV
jgi:V8-like Glu-specific endopeptidase